MAKLLITNTNVITIDNMVVQPSFSIDRNSFGCMAIGRRVLRAIHRYDDFVTHLTSIISMFCKVSLKVLVLLLKTIRLNVGNTEKCDDTCQNSNSTLQQERALRAHLCDHRFKSKGTNRGTDLTDG
jgi:hypothetical protein